MNHKTQYLLKQTDNNPHSSISSAKRTFSDIKIAESFFSILKKNVIKIDEWNKNSNLSSYLLFAENGQELEKQILAPGVFNRIYLKGSGKYDWVQVTDIYDSFDEFIIRVKPTYDPTDKKIDKSITSHFFTDEATNNFCLLKHENTISFYVVGLNEKQNTQETKNTIETIRNMATANLGPILGIQKAEWETFAKNFLYSENP